MSIINLIYLVDSNTLQNIQIDLVHLSPKRQFIITEQLEGHMLSMYAKGMSTRVISDFIREMYAIEISTTEISHITQSVMPSVNECWSRPIEAFYPFVLIECMHYKVRQNGNWINLFTFFEYDEQVRKTIYTTNPI